jgi:hypothetical protein
MDAESFLDPWTANLTKSEISWSSDFKEGPDISFLLIALAISLRRVLAGSVNKSTEHVTYKCFHSTSKKIEKIENAFLTVILFTIMILYF